MFDLKKIKLNKNSIMIAVAVLVVVVTLVLVGVNLFGGSQLSFLKLGMGGSQNEIAKNAKPFVITAFASLFAIVAGYYPSIIAIPRGSRSRIAMNSRLKARKS